MDVTARRTRQGRGRSPALVGSNRDPADRVESMWDQLDQLRFSEFPDCGDSMSIFLSPFESQVPRIESADVVVCALAKSPEPASVPWNEPDGVPLGVVPGIWKVAFP